MALLVASLFLCTFATTAFGQLGTYQGPECFDLNTCLECMCGIESNENERTCSTEYGPDETCTMGGHCNNRDLNNRIGVCYCGSRQIGESYFAECSNATEGYTVPINDWVNCTEDYDCSEQCVRNYLDKYRFQCTGQTDPDLVSCVDNWRIHRGGPAGCNSAQPGEAFLGTCCETPAMGCITEESCMAWLCGSESGEGTFQCGTEFGAPDPSGEPNPPPLLCAPNNACNPGPLPSNNDTCFCGVYQVTYEYFRICSTTPGYTVPDMDLNRCTADHACATQCVLNYIDIHYKNCFPAVVNSTDLNCRQRALVHRDGPNGCTDPSATLFSDLVMVGCNTPQLPPRPSTQPPPPASGGSNGGGEGSSGGGEEGSSGGSEGGATGGGEEGAGGTEEPPEL